MNWPIKANWPAQRRTRFGPITEDQRNPRYNNQFELGGFSSSQISLLFCQPPFLISEAVVVPFLKIEGRSSREQRMNGRKVEVQQLPNLITRYIAGILQVPRTIHGCFSWPAKRGTQENLFRRSVKDENRDDLLSWSDSYWRGLTQQKKLFTATTE